MKKKILAVCALVALFGLGIAAYAYTLTAADTRVDRPSCCAKSDSCPMNAHKADGAKTHESCPMKAPKADAGKAHESCPMKAHITDTAKADGHNCCECFGDSCPMKKSGEATATASAAAAAVAKTDCCCDCCKA